MKSWSMYVGNHSVGVSELPSGDWLADIRLKIAIDPCGTSARQEVFSTVKQALHFIGYPVDILGIPKTLQ